jgi:hypothetical protein
MTIGRLVRVEAITLAHAQENQVRHQTIRATSADSQPVEMQLEAFLQADVGHDPVDVVVHDVCGAIEVRVSGPKGRLRLVFDRAELDPAYVRSVVRRTLSRYSACLGGRPSGKRHMHMPRRTESGVSLAPV